MPPYPFSLRSSPRPTLAHTPPVYFSPPLQPAAHTCFRQLDLPRYRSLEEVREKVNTAITIGQGYMGIS